MKVAFLLNNLSGGGAERVVVTLSNKLAQKGHTVDLVLARATGPFMASVSSDVRVIELFGRRMLYAIPSLVWILNRKKYDVVISGLDQPNIALLISKWFATSRTKFVVTEHNHPVASNAGAKKLIWRTVRSLRSLLYRHSDHVIAVSQVARQALISNFSVKPENCTAIYNSVDVKKAMQLASQKIHHKWFDENCKVFVAVGRLTLQKNYPLMLRALKIARRSADVRLLILGEGSERPSLKNLVSELGLEESVQLLGFQDNPFSYIGRSSGLLMTSDWEGLPTVLIEAMACGITPVSTDCPSGPSELLGKSEYGYLVPMGDADLFAGAMLEAVNYPKPAKLLTERAQGFSPDRVAQNYENLFGNLIGKRG